jgi:hypothetical protein
MKSGFKYPLFLSCFLAVFLLHGHTLFSQIGIPVYDDEMGPPPPLKLSERAKKWGPNDTIIVAAIWHDGEWMPYKELEMAWVSNMSAKKLAKYVEEWTRLRNAVYVTYPYARIAAITINDINAKLENITAKKARKEYIKSREKELRTQFGEPLENLSVYQGKILMKLINRQTGNNCYEIIKEYKSGFTARFYQTVAFFFGGNLKQDWDLKEPVDRLIESFVQEIDVSWYNNPYRQQPIVK